MDNSKCTKKNRLPRSPHTWHLVTNHQNMLYMLAAGMMMGPAGFRGKHYSDPLGVYPGYVPLFRGINKGKGYIPANALQQAVSERKHLLPCIASFDLANLSGPAFRLTRDGCVRGIESTLARRLPNDIANLVPAPLPMNLLQSITFRSAEDRQRFETAAGDVANVDLPDSLIKVDESLFLTDSKITWPPSPRQARLEEVDDLPSFDDAPPQRGQAIGGLLTMLYHAANHSDLGLAVFRFVTGAADNHDNGLLLKNPVLRECCSWLEEGSLREQEDVLPKIYWGVVDALIDSQSQESLETPIDAALAHLKLAHEGLQEQKFKDALEQLIADMRGCLGLGGGTITELFERHKGPLSRSLLLFCLREHSRDLIEFSHPMLADADYILACILFGVRDGWLRLPRELRDPSLSDYVSYRMAEVEQQSRESGLAFTSPLPPIPLRACFSASGGEWSEQQKEMALGLADKCGWNDCIQTYITPQTGDVLEIVERDNSRLVIRGSASVTKEVDSTAFLRRLGKWPLAPFQIQDEIRSAFKRESDLRRRGNGGDRP